MIIVLTLQAKGCSPARSRSSLSRGQRQLPSIAMKAVCFEAKDLSSWGQYRHGLLNNKLRESGESQTNNKLRLQSWEMSLQWLQLQRFSALVFDFTILFSFNCLVAMSVYFPLHGSGERWERKRNEKFKLSMFSSDRISSIGKYLKSVCYRMTSIEWKLRGLWPILSIPLIGAHYYRQKLQSNVSQSLCAIHFTENYFPKSSKRVSSLFSPLNEWLLCQAKTLWQISICL